MCIISVSNFLGGWLSFKLSENEQNFSIYTEFGNNPSVVSEKAEFVGCRDQTI